MDYSTPGFEGIHIWKEVENLFTTELQAVFFSVYLIYTSVNMFLRFYSSKKYKHEYSVKFQLSSYSLFKSFIHL